MRDKLIELIQESVDGCARYWAERIADNLLANGVIVPPCNVGDDVWWINDETNEIKCVKRDITAVVYCGNGEFKVITKDETEPEALHTKWCMLSKEEAENALAERNRG